MIRLSYFLLLPEHTDKEDIIMASVCGLLWLTTMLTIGSLNSCVISLYNYSSVLLSASTSGFLMIQLMTYWKTIIIHASARRRAPHPSPADPHCCRWK
jgi:hypothetical protein